MLSTVKVSRDDLLAKLKENKAKHVREYDSAVEVFRGQAEKALRKRASEVRDGESLSLSVDLTVPQSYGAEYDRAIAMVEWSTEGELDLDEHDFRAFVLDEWDWRGHFAATTSHYNRR